MNKSKNLVFFIAVNFFVLFLSASCGHFGHHSCGKDRGTESSKCMSCDKCGNKEKCSENEKCSEKEKLGEKEKSSK
jgi:hypothetical protein